MKNRVVLGSHQAFVRHEPERWDCVMILPFAPSAWADIEAIVLAIANSPIVARRTALEALLADWENTRLSPEIDDVILAWIAREASQRRRERAS